MSKILENATAHFRNKISGEMHSVKVPEWGDAEIFYKEANTLQEEARLLTLAQQGKTVEALVETLITKARNKDGSKMFKMADKVTFMNEVDPSVLIRVCGEMNAGNENIEIVEKN